VLEASLSELLATSDCRVLLLGRHSDGFREELIASRPDLAARIRAPGALSDEDLSRHVSACDVMLQPYPDGVSSRRTSVMVALSHAKPVVTTCGPLSESLWSDERAVALAPANDPVALAAVTAGLLHDAGRRRDLTARAHALYTECFDLVHTIERLRSPDVD
jgi:glycosyltransferase involved in cell wall biosynthesis